MPLTAHRAGSVLALVGLIALVQTSVLLPAAEAAEESSIRHISGPIEPRSEQLAEMTRRTVAHASALAARGLARTHVLLQLAAIPSADQRRAMEDDGVRFGAYLPERAWVVSLPGVKVADVVARHDVTWIQPWTGNLKLHPRAASGNWAPWARDPERPGWVAVFVQLHRDVAIGRGAELAAEHGGRAFDPVQGLHGLTVLIRASSVAALAAEEDVLWIEEVPPPLTHTNDGARTATGVDVVHEPPYLLNGAGTNLFVFDGGRVRETHETFTDGLLDRVILIDTAMLSGHATHVAGTAAGDGSGSDNSRALGMAPDAIVLSAGVDFPGPLIFWVDVGDIEEDYQTARNDHQADLANNSLGSNTAKLGYPCDLEGGYGLASELIDGIARGDNPLIDGPVLMVWSNGNERTGADFPSLFRGRCGSNFLTTAPPACAKNSIQVGATHSDGGAMTKFSSWGPCDDGRLKPIVTAPGCESGRVLEDGIYSSTSAMDSTYGLKCGTSMAAPVVSGILNLFLQEWRYLGFGGPQDRPFPALVRAMIVHTARDQGVDGPDYMFGYGQVNAPALVDLLRGDTPGWSQWETHTLVHNECQSEEIEVPPRSSELKVTIAWDDVAAAAYSAFPPVNDLILYLESPQGDIHNPWILDPADPMAAATTGVNEVDNQEQVVVRNPEIGTWERWVCADLPEGPQSYGVVSSVTPRTVAEHTCTELISNGHFADNTWGWTLDGAHREACPATIPGLGPYCLAFGGMVSEVDQAWTEVTIPEGAVRANLTGQWYMTTDEGFMGHGYDIFNVEVKIFVLTRAVLDQRWDQLPEIDWLSSTKLPFDNLDLTPWAGSNVRLAFRADNDEQRPTEFWIGNLSLEACLGVAVFSDGFESGGVSAWSQVVD